MFEICLQYFCNITPLRFDRQRGLCYSGYNTDMTLTGGVPMGLFNSQEDYQRKANLMKLEDKRVAMAQRMAREGFAPEKMLFAQLENGGFTAVCRFNGRFWLIVSPGFGSDDEFIFESFDAPDYTVQQVNVKPEGMEMVQKHGPYELHGDPEILRNIDILLSEMVQQNRMKLSQEEYTPCYRLVE